MSVPDISSLNLNSINTDEMNLIQYINHLYATNDKSYDNVIQILKSQYYLPVFESRYRTEG